MRPRLAAAVLAAALAAPGALAAAPWRVDVERSSFVVLVHRAGFASGLAHDHLIVARAPDCSLDFDPAAPRAAALACRQPVLALDVDPPAERARLAPRLALLGALTGDLPPIDDDERAKVRGHMLDARQLFAERFPEIRVTLLALAPRGEDEGGESGARVALGWNAKLRVEVRGEAVETTAPVRWQVDDGELSGELLAELRFTDFRIEPYSAVLGAVRNADLFHLYVDLVARPAALTPAP